MSDKIIKVTCKGADVLPIDSIENFQGNLKKITKQNLEKLKKRIIKDGINVPLFVWRVNDWCRILDGHQRLKALLSLRSDGYELPLIPVAYIEAEDEKDARQKLLGITSQYGEFEIEELSEWMKEFDDEIINTLSLSEGKIEIINEVNLNDFNSKVSKKEKELLTLTVFFPDKKYKTLFFMKLQQRYGNEISVEEKFKKLIEEL
jgi:hypothetical protein